MLLKKRFLFLLPVLLVFAITGYAQSSVHFINVGQADSILIEFPRAAVLIDAGGESTVDDRDAEHLHNYLDQFFQRRTDLNHTIHTVIISHPHIDHTKLLMGLMNTYRVLNLIDGGNNQGSGIKPLQEARTFAQAHGISYSRILDSNVGGNGFTNPALNSLHTADPSVEVRLLSGSRDCANANNDSLVVWVRYGAAKFLFTGDAEADDDQKCTSELTHLLEKYHNTQLLNVDILKVSHHGSANGTTAAWMQAVSPRISVISAGVPSVASPEEFHAWFFGHPREQAVQQIEQGTGDNRQQPLLVMTMDGVKRVHHRRQITKAVYCTCWDGDVVIHTNQTGTAFSVAACPRS